MASGGQGGDAEPNAMDVEEVRAWPAPAARNDARGVQSVPGAAYTRAKHLGGTRLTAARARKQGEAGRRAASVPVICGDLRGVFHADRTIVSFDGAQQSPPLPGPACGPAACLARARACICTPQVGDDGRTHRWQAVRRRQGPVTLRV